MAQRIASFKRISQMNVNTTNPGITELPAGRCNFTVLSAGGGRCGCLRFWDKRQDLESIVSPGWCMCEHHACFHQVHAKSDRSLHISAQSSFQTTSLSSTILTTAPGDSFHQPQDVVSPSSPDARPVSPAACTDSDLPATYSGTPAQAAVPLLSADCRLPEDLDSNSLHFDPRASRNCRSNEHIAHSLTGKPNGAAAEDPDSLIPTQQNTPVEGSRQSQLVVAIENDVSSLQADVKSMAEALNLRAHKTQQCIGVQSASDAALLNGAATPLMLEKVMSHLMTILKCISHFPALSTVVNNHARRIDLLENASYSDIESDELRIQIDNLEDFVHDLESKVDDLRKSVTIVNDFAGRGRESSGESSIHVDTATLLRADIDARLEQLQGQLAEYRSDYLTTATPTRTHPWEIEVVYVPFGLKGIWYTMQDFLSQRSHRSSQVSGTGPSETDHPADNTFWREIAEEADDRFEWLVPRAFSTGTRVEQRLMSRGFIKRIFIRGPEARDVDIAIMSEFSDVLDMVMTWDEFEGFGYVGLRAPWIPLRKRHKDSMLQLLDPPELLTPALWTSQFLSSSVIMRAAGTCRLFVTHRDAYLQSDPCCNAWTWKRLQELFIVRPNESGRIAHSPDSPTSTESCWDYDPRLDAVCDETHLESSLNPSMFDMPFVTYRKRDASTSSSVSDLPVQVSPVYTRRIQQADEAYATTLQQELQQSQCTNSLPLTTGSLALSAKRPHHSQSFGDQIEIPKRRRTLVRAHTTDTSSLPFAYATPRSASRNSVEFYYEDLDATSDASDGDSLLDGDAQFLEGLEGFLIGNGSDSGSDDDDYGRVDEIDEHENDTVFGFGVGVELQDDTDVWEGISERGDVVDDAADDQNDDG